MLSIASSSIGFYFAVMPMQVIEDRPSMIKLAIVTIQVEISLCWALGEELIIAVVVFIKLIEVR